MSRPARKRNHLVAIVGLAMLASALLFACGSGSNSDSSYIVPSDDLISSGNRPSVPQPTWPGPNSESATPPGAAAGSETGTAAAEANPCGLVSKGEAATILGGSVRTSLGRQGPTCIYAPEGSGPQMTLVVEQTSLPGLKRNAAQATPMQVGGTSGWCLRYGSTSVVASLPDGSVLHVTGPCALAARFAAQALGQLSPS
jgi:Protein of unknown function (DUF3558)